MDLLEKFLLKFNTPSSAIKTNFFRLLSLGQKAWLGIREALIALSKSEKDKNMRLIIEDLIKQVNQWLTLGDALENHDYFFSLEEREMVKSSELMGNLPATLDRIALDLEQYETIKRKIKSAMTYPVILITVTIVAVIVLLVKVIPTIVGLFPSQDDLPAITKLMLSVSDFVKAHWYALGIGGFSIVAGHKLLLAYVPPYKIFLDWLQIKIPVLQEVVKVFHMYRFSKNFGDFYKSWVSPVVSLTHIGNIFTNFFYKRKVWEVKKNLEWWFSLGESLDWSDLFDPLLIQIIEVGEKTGNIDTVLEKAALFYKEQLDVKIGILMQFIEPILMMLIATVIGSVVGAIFLPMADLLNVLGG